MRTFPLLLLLLCNSAFAQIDAITLTLPSQKDNTHLYYHELLQRSLALVNVQLNIQTLDKHIPQKRMVKMVERDQLSLMWLIQTGERDAKYGYIDTPITNGLIGQRVMLIPKGSQKQYQRISTLADLQKSGLVGGLGINWYDEKVWKANGLAVFTQDGEWRELYQLLTANGKVNYFPRGVNEIKNEALFNPHLEIERSLLLVYERDYRFYLSESAEEYRLILNQALEKALAVGLVDELVEKYWKQDLEQLSISTRTKIMLKNP